MHLLPFKQYVLSIHGIPLKVQDVKPKQKIFREKPQKKGFLQKYKLVKDLVFTVKYEIMIAQFPTFLKLHVTYCKKTS